MRLLYLFAVLFLLNSCGINSNIMFKDTKKFEYNTPPLNETQEYRISANEILSFRLLSDDGFPLINPNQGNISTNITTMNVEFNGLVKFPYLGRVKLEGMTIRQAEAFLEEKYSEFFRKPYVILNVINRRVIVSPGSGGTAMVVTLTNNNTTVMEVLAIAGGIVERGDASKIKLIRKVGETREIYKIDLSTIDGLEMADMAVQADDIIYVQPRKRFAAEIAEGLAPYLSLLSSTLLVITYIRTGSR